jgi:hypothetical protein
MFTPASIVDLTARTDAAQEAAKKNGIVGWGSLGVI